MKKQKSILIALPLVLAMLFVSLAPFAVVPAKATALDNNITGPTIYYFNDYYPSISKDAMEQTCPDYNVVYDHQWLDNTSFSALVFSGYFTGFSSDSVVFIDIKTFKPNETVLLNLFMQLKVNCGCKTVFVTVYDETDFANQDFTSLLDLYYRSDLAPLDSFIDQYVDEVFPYPSGEDDNDPFLAHTIVIDGRLLETDGINALNVHERIANSPFMTRLLDTLAARGNISVSDYDDILGILKNVYNIEIMVHVGGDDFVSLCDYLTQETTNISELGNNVSVMAFWSLTSDMYTIIEQENGVYPVYVMEADPIVYREDGVCVVSHSSYGSGEELELLAALAVIL